MQNLLRGFTVGLILFLSGFSLGEEGGPETKRVRDRDACGVYLAKASYQDGKRRIDNTNGVLLSSLDVNEFREALKEIDSLDGDLMLAGLPIYGKERREFEAAIDEVLKQWGRDLRNVRVKTVPKPGGPLWKRVLEEVRYFFPLGSDYQKPVREEVIPGLGWVAFSDSSIIAYAFAKFEPKVAIPMIIMATGANAALTAYMRFMTNWMNRSESRKTERFAKQLIPAAFFVATYYFVAQWPEYWESIQSNGLMENLKQIIPTAIQFVKDQGVTMASHTAFFTATFTGINLWDQMKSQTPEGNEQVRRVRPFLQGVIFLVTGPILTMASTSEEFIYEFNEYIRFNEGHKWMAYNGLLGLVIWRFPQLLNPVGPVVDTLVYKPFEYVKPYAMTLLRPVGAVANALVVRPLATVRDFVLWMTGHSPKKVREVDEPEDDLSEVVNR